MKAHDPYTDCKYQVNKNCIPVVGLSLNKRVALTSSYALNFLFLIIDHNVQAVDITARRFRTSGKLLDKTDHIMTMLNHDPASNSECGYSNYGHGGPCKWQNDRCH